MRAVSLLQIATPSRGAIEAYGNLQSDVDASIERTQLKHGHVFLGVIPLFHAFGMTAMMLAPIQLGTPVVYIARFSPVATVNAIREHKVSLLFGVSSTDAVTLVAAIAVVVAAGMAATLLPARRASRVHIASMMREN